jgi:intracellular sulfur oxidation DsrE/DsrF family protein
MKRSMFLASSASLAVIGTAHSAAQGTVPGGTQLVERKADFNATEFARLVGKPADIRQMWEAVAFKPAVFNNIKNSLNALQFGFGYAPARIAMVFCPHGPSTAYTYSDDIWSKYKIGDFYKTTDTKGNPVATNVFLKPSKPLNSSTDPDDENGAFQDTSIETLQKRGVIFLTCHTAVEEQARALVKAGNAPAGMSARDVADDLLTHLIPGTHVVPGMVAAVAVLQQRFHYSYITLVL